MSHQRVHSSNLKAVMVCTGATRPRRSVNLDTCNTMSCVDQTRQHPTILEATPAIGYRFCSHPAIENERRSQSFSMVSINFGRWWFTSVQCPV